MDSLLYRFASRATPWGKLEIDPDVHFLISEAFDCTVWGRPAPYNDFASPIKNLVSQKLFSMAAGEVGTPSMLLQDGRGLAGGSGALSSKPAGLGLWTLLSRGRWKLDCPKLSRRLGLKMSSFWVEESWHV